MSARYELWDVFTQVPFGGNPLAVFLDSPDLPAAAMQTLAAELNLSESVFVTPSERDGCGVRLRIFTPKAEMPIAGHPTVGAVCALAANGRLADGLEAAVEEGVGPIPVRAHPGDPPRAAMSQPIPQLGDAPVGRADAAAAVGLPESALVADVPLVRGSAGVPFLYVPVRDLEAAAAAALDAAFWAERLRDSSAPQVVVYCRETTDPEADAHVRMFAPALGIPEDPATGAAAGPLGAHLSLTTGPGRHRWILEQGIEVGRPSLIEVETVGATEALEAVWVGGSAVRVGGGELLVPSVGEGGGA